MAKAQSLEASRLKYAMMGELMENSGKIKDGTFFDMKRDASKNTSITLQNQLVE